MSFKITACFHRLAFLLACLVLAACGAQEPVETPGPGKLTRDDIGYLCGMIVMDHAGPKSQIFVSGKQGSLWFTTVRDGVAFTLLPEETRPIQVFYVTAMDQAEWDHPENDSGNWIEASAAWFVIDSEKLGSMGAPEVIPFRDQQVADAFVSQNGGRALKLEEIPRDYILGNGQAVGDIHEGHSM